MKTTYQTWVRFLWDVADGALAEYQGCKDAALYDTPQSYAVSRFQSRYDQGFRDGREKLAAEEALK